MRKIRIIVHVSLDGISRPEGADDYANGGWTVPFRTPEGREAVIAAHGERFDLLLGRRTYDQFSGFWPKAGDTPLANSLNAATKFVATRSVAGLGWGPVETVGPDTMKSVRDLKETEGPDLVVLGSLTLTPELFGQRLVDELFLVVYPITLGRGKRFFAEIADPQELALVSTKATSSGVVINKYETLGLPRSKA